MATNPLDVLINHGFHELRPCDDLSERTVIVLGVARGGTSMVAGALSRLGVHMGDGINEIVYEDLTFSRAVESRDQRQVRSIIKDRNERFRIWGWKRPASLYYIDALESQFRNPVYIVVFRDVFAIANRNRLSMTTDVVANMRRNLQEYLKLIEFLAKSSAPCMLVSYDKALSNKEAFVRHLAKFIGVDDGESVRSAIKSIRPATPRYLNGTRITRSVGCVDKVSPDCISGWARYRRTRNPIEVQLLINGQEVMQTKANIFRPDALADGRHPTGRCGFSFGLSEKSRLQYGDEIRVRAVNDVRDLNNSPCRYPSETLDEGQCSSPPAPVPKRIQEPDRSLTWVTLRARGGLIITRMLHKLGARKR